MDGEKDKCSLGEDINFVFTGFSLQGKVGAPGSFVCTFEDRILLILLNVLSFGMKDVVKRQLVLCNSGHMSPRLTKGTLQHSAIC